MEKRPRSVSAAILLLVVSSLLWLAFSILIAGGAHPSYGVGSEYRWPAALSAFLVAAVLGSLAVHLRTPSRLGYWSTVAALAAVIFMLLFDQFGPADLAVAAITALPLILLLKDRGWYLARAPAGDPSVE